MVHKIYTNLLKQEAHGPQRSSDCRSVVIATIKNQDCLIHKDIANYIILVLNKTF